MSIEKVSTILGNESAPNVETVRERMASQLKWHAENIEAITTRMEYFEKMGFLEMTVDEFQKKFHLW